jgi:peptidoglycan lytic transglycosylase
MPSSVARIACYTLTVSPLQGVIMLRAIAIALLLSLSFFSNQAAAQSLQNRASEIRAAMDARDFSRAEQLVRNLRAADHAAAARNNYDYLLARLVERRGAASEASSLYLSVLNRNSTLAEYALRRLAAVAQQIGDLALERQYLNRLLASHPTSVLATGARDRLIESLQESGDTRASINLLRPQAAATGVRGRAALARLGQAYAKVGDASAARSAFDQLVSGARDDYALAAASGLDALDHTVGARPDEFEALRRARIYLSNRHWVEARTHLLDIVERFPDSQNRAEALYQMGYAYYREDNYDEAIKWFERAHTEFPSKKEGEQGYYWVATALQKAQRYPEAARRYIDFISAYPKSDLIEGAYRNLVDSFRYAGDIAEAIAWSRRMGEIYAGKPLATVALFNEARIELVRGNFETALSLLTKLQAHTVYPRLVSAPIRGEAAFLRIYALEQMGRTNEAASGYLAISDGRDNYFGQRATIRLQALAKTKEGRAVIEPLARGYEQQARAALRAGRYAEAKDAAAQALRLIEDSQDGRAMLDILRTSYSNLPGYSSVWRYRLIPAARDVIAEGAGLPADRSHQRIAAELLFLGLYDEGVTELRLGGFGGARASADAADDTQTAAGDVGYSMAVYSNRGDQADAAIAFIEPQLRSIPQDYRTDLMPRDLAELIYPAPYRDSLNRYSSKFGTDARLVLSLARQESRFKPSVKSGAAARGLLQFIAETALKLAREEGMEDFQLDDVYNPDVAVRLASRHVADLLKQFPNNPYAVAASYNTGEQNVERWIFRSRSTDVDRLVAEIALPETKDYVAKVMSNYRAYRQLYTQDLKKQ